MILNSNLKHNPGLIIVVLLLICTHLSAFSQNKRVLLLHSYNNGLKWTDDINKGMQDVLIADTCNSYDIRCEYMDTKRYKSENYLSLYQKYISEKYQHTDFDLILCSDNAAYQFLIQYHDSLFPKAPVVFCGVNYCDSVPANFTGIMEDINIKNNIELIKTLHPNYNKLYIINDTSLTAQLIKRQITASIDTNFTSLRYEFLTDYSMKELQTKLKGLAPNDVVLLLVFNFDNQGSLFSYDVLLNYLLPFCDNPIYGVWDFYLDRGIVGGEIISGYKHGAQSAQIAIQLINGKDTEQIRVTSGATSRMFDYNQLKKHSISTEILTEGYETINKPLEFFRIDKKFFILLISSLALMALLSIILLIQKKKIKRSLKREKELSAIIETKSNEIQLALKKVEETDSLKTKFLKNISHEVRTPINGIVGYSDMLFDVKDQDDVHKDYVNTIKKCSIQLISIIDDIVNMALIESNQVEIERTEVDIFKLFEALLIKQLSFSGANNIKIGDCDEKTARTIYTDYSKLQQIFANLISNANKFSNYDTVEIGYHVKDNNIEFYFKDKGIGIPPEHLQKIFTPFWQVDQTATKLYGGNGLGLSIVKAYTEMLDGDVWAESELHTGSIFYISIPMHNSADSPPL